MARAAFISEFEQEVIRIGVAHKVPQKAIAQFLGRSPAVITVQDRKSVV